MVTQYKRGPQLRELAIPQKKKTNKYKTHKEKKKATKN